MSFWGEVDVEIDGNELDAEVRYRDLIQELAEQFNKTEEEVQKFLEIQDDELWNKVIYFKDTPCYGTASVSNDDISEISEAESRLDNMEKQFDNYVDNVHNIFHYLVNWYYIEGGRNDTSKLGQMVGEIVKKLDL